MTFARFARTAAAVASMAAVGAAHASAITTDQWYFFSFGATGSALGGSMADTYDIGPISGLGTPDGSWDITLTETSQIFWTDLQISGDRFEFFANGMSIGSSGPDVAFGSSTGTDIAAALADPNYGKGSAILGPGSYTITGTFLGVVAFGDGAFIVRSGVPEPASLALVGLALAGLGLSGRRRA